MAILIVIENGATLNTAGNNMMQRPGGVNAGLSWHGRNVSKGEPMCQVNKLRASPILPILLHPIFTLFQLATFLISVYFLTGLASYD